MARKLGIITSLRLDKEIDLAIDDYRKSFERIPNRSDVIKMLLRAGLSQVVPEYEYDIDAAMAQLQRDMYGGSDEDESETGEQGQEQETVEKTDSDEDETEEEAAA